jgi:hypothetical protein
VLTTVTQVLTPHLFARDTMGYSGPKDPTYRAAPLEACPIPEKEHPKPFEQNSLACITTPSQTNKNHQDPKLLINPKKKYSLNH